MRLLASILLLVTFTGSLKAQFPRINLGPEAPTTHADLKLSCITELDNGHRMVIRSNYAGDGSRYSIEIFDEGNTSIAFHPLKISVPESDKLFYVESIKLGSQVVVLVSHYQAANKSHVLYAIPADEKGMHEAQKTELDKMPAFNPGNCGKFRINISPDHQQLIVLREHPSDKTKNESIALKTFNSSLKETWQKEHLYDIPSRPHPVNLPYISNSGDVYVIKKDRDKTQYKFLILSIDHSNHHLVAKPINVTGLMISDIKAGLLENGNLAVFGFYSSQNYSDYEGMFYFAFDKTGNVASKHHETLNSEILSIFMGKKEATKDGAALSGFALHHLIPQKNGGLYVLAEKSMQVTEDNKEHYSYEDLLILNLDHFGNVKWGRGIKKKQESYNDHAKWSSYNFWLHNDTLNIIHNKVFPDDQLSKTGKRKKADEFGEKIFYGSTWTMITPNGLQTSSPLLDAKGESIAMSLNPELLFQNEKGYVIMIAEDYLNQRHRLAEMQFYKH